MTRTRTLLILAICTSLALVGAPPGQAKHKRFAYKLGVSCKTKHTTSRDFIKIRAVVKRKRRGTRGRDPVRRAKVITTLHDLNLRDGNNALTEQDKDRTNRRGIARTRNEFNRRGDYQVSVIARHRGHKVGEKFLTVTVEDRKSGRCKRAAFG